MGMNVMMYYIIYVFIMVGLFEFGINVVFFLSGI